MIAETTNRNFHWHGKPSHMLLARFLQDRNGGVAPDAGARLIPLVGAVGAAVDYSRANSVRTAMQAALDSTALMLSKDAQSLNGGPADREGDDLFQRPVQPAGSAQRPGHASSSARRSRATSP